MQIARLICHCRSNYFMDESNYIIPQTDTVVSCMPI